jgi:hypothetical protein
VDFIEGVVNMAVTKLQASQIARAAAQGVAIALSNRPQQPKEEFVLPHIICGIPAHIFQAELKADREGNVTVGAVTETKIGG